MISHQMSELSVYIFFAPQFLHRHDVDSFDITTVQGFEAEITLKASLLDAVSIYHRKLKLRFFLELFGEKNNFANIGILTFIAVNGRGEVFFSEFLISFGLKADGVFFFVVCSTIRAPVQSQQEIANFVCSTTKTSLSASKSSQKKTANNSQHSKLQLKCNFTCYFTLILHCRMRSHLLVFFFFFFCGEAERDFWQLSNSNAEWYWIDIQEIYFNRKKTAKKKAAKKKRKKDLWEKLRFGQHTQLYSDFFVFVVAVAGFFLLLFWAKSLIEAERSEWGGKNVENFLFRVLFSARARELSRRPLERDRMVK